MANNNFDIEAAKRFYLYLKSIPFNIYTKVTIYITNILVSIFNNLRDMKYNIGIDL